MNVLNKKHQVLLVIQNVREQMQRKENTSLGSENGQRFCRTFREPPGDKDG